MGPGFAEKNWAPKYVRLTSFMPRASQVSRFAIGVKSTTHRFRAVLFLRLRFQLEKVDLLGESQKFHWLPRQ
jgi:hypothetical protein